jgi:hypothetical protein
MRLSRLAKEFGGWLIIPAAMVILATTPQSKKPKNKDEYTIEVGCGYIIIFAFVVLLIILKGI